jgi:hypothetical protein
VVQHELLLRSQECEGVGAHPRGGDDGFCRIDAAPLEHLVDRLGDLLGRRDDAGIVESPGELHGA